MLKDDFRAFLASFKSSEGLTPELRREIQVSTNLERHAAAALQQGRTVLITGSAGSGKSHLLSTVLATAADGLRIATPDEAPRTLHLTVVNDATEYTAAERAAFLTRTR